MFEIKDKAQDSRPLPAGAPMLDSVIRRVRVAEKGG